MEARIKKLWVRELRGDDFTQGERALRAGDACCCLGVLCELAIEQGLEVKVVIRAGTLSLYTYDDEIGYLPESVSKWAGLDIGTQSILMGMNDIEEKDFKAIADYIEENL